MCIKVDDLGIVLWMLDVFGIDCVLVGVVGIGDGVGFVVLVCWEGGC